MYVCVSQEEEEEEEEEEEDDKEEEEDDKEEEEEDDNEEEEEEEDGGERQGGQQCTLYIQVTNYTASSAFFIYFSHQMEYCCNQTLRQLIDSKSLYSYNDSQWQLFRELVEGLAHIHSQV